MTTPNPNPNTQTSETGEDKGGNNRFNAEAQNWDSNPSVLRATELAHEAYLSRLGLPASESTVATYDVLEIGCGTGLLSLRLAPAVRSLTAVDAAEGMISVLRSKLSSSSPAESQKIKIKNVLPVAAMLTSPDDPRIQIDPLTGNPVINRRFDLVLSHLVLHHIADLESLFKTMHGCLKPGGRVMVTDFEDFGPAARRFHPEAKMEGVERHGIQRGAMRELLAGSGFRGVRVETAFEMEKAVERVPGEEGVEVGVEGGDAEKMVFPFLICEGTR
jgi:SAM-dependent methyltransferase